MTKDKYTAIWVSHSSISDFLVCPRAYFLKNIYRDPRTGHKIALINPAMALGQAVHEVIESLSILPVAKRLEEPLLDKLDKAWKKISGKRGGFINKDTEERYKERGRAMLRRVIKNPGPLKNLAVKINRELPYFWLSEKDNIILCGKIDWLEYLKENNSVQIIDFKTGKNKEKPDSLQLLIYYLLASHCQDRPVTKVSYWYLETDNRPIEQKLANIDAGYNQVLKIAKKIKVARQLERFKCPDNGCRTCKAMEKILKGEAELVGTGGFNHKTDIYMLNQPESKNIETSKIL